MIIKKIILDQNFQDSLSFCLYNNSKLIIIHNKNKKSFKYLKYPNYIFIEKIKNRLLIKSFDFFKMSVIYYSNLFVNTIRHFNKEYSKKLVLRGLGYKMTLTDFNILKFKLGFSHLIDVKVPLNKIFVKIRKNRIFLKSFDNSFLGNFCQKIKTLKLPNVYNRKGFKLRRKKIKYKTFKKK